MKYLISVAFIIASIFGGFAYFGQSNGVGGGLGTIEQLSLWFFDGTNITQNTSGTPVKLTGYESSGDCLVTNASGVLATSSCGGGGSSKWTDGGTYIFPSTGESIEVSTIAATSTATSTFAGPITMAHPYYLTTHGIRGDASDGLYVIANNGTAVADFGIANTANSSFFGAVNIDGATRLATSLNGVLQAQAGAVTATSTGNLTETVTGLQFDNTRALIGGSAILSLTSGYDIPLSASTTEWSGFYNTPSSRITAGNYLSWSGNTLNASVQISTSSSNGALAFWTGSSALGSVATGTLTETATGLELSATRGLVGGAAVLALTSGYGIPLTASTTEWTNFYNTPSTRITAGNGLSWSGNTLTATSTHEAVTLSGALDYITLVGQDIVRGAIDLATDITGVLADDNGGTGQSTYTTGDTLYASGANTLAKRAIGTTGDVLSVVGGVPSWVATSSLGIGGSGTPGGSTTQLQYNNAGSFAGARLGYTESSATNYLTPTNADGTIRLAATGTGAIAAQSGNAAIRYSVANNGLFFENDTNSLFYFYNAGSRAGIFDFTNVASSNKTFTWPNESGTVALTKRNTYKTFTWPGTSTTTAATSTIPLGTAYTAEAWNGAECWVTNSTGAVIFTDGTNRMNGFTATTTAARTTLSVNNTFTDSERRYMEVGILTGAQLSCTVDVTINN